MSNSINIKRAINFKLFLTTLFLLSSFQKIFPQDNKINNFLSLSCPEKRWVILHPFIAKKTFNISIEAKNETENLMDDNQMDGDKNGGQIDAFRHAYWMARLSQEISWRKARWLGKAHEKGNKISYKKNKTEDGNIPDAISCKMDLLNNNIGLIIGQANSKVKTEEMVLIIKSKVLKGDLWIIKKDKFGHFLDSNNRIITDKDIAGKWENSKCLVKSNNK